MWLTQPNPGDSVSKATAGPKETERSADITDTAAKNRRISCACLVQRPQNVWKGVEQIQCLHHFGRVVEGTRKEPKTRRPGVYWLY